MFWIQKYFILKAAFKTYVSPVLEYSSVVWNPFLIKDIDKLEKVQRRFTKRLPGLKHYTYFQQLNRLDLESLELRRLRQDLIFTYKLVFRLVDPNLNDFVDVLLRKFVADTVINCFCPHATHSSTRFNFFAYRVLRIWNVLPHAPVRLQVSNVLLPQSAKISKGIF